MSTQSHPPIHQSNSTEALCARIRSAAQSTACTNPFNSTRAPHSHIKSAAQKDCMHTWTVAASSPRLKTGLPQQGSHRSRPRLIQAYQISSTKGPHAHLDSCSLLSTPEDWSFTTRQSPLTTSMTLPVKLSESFVCKQGTIRSVLKNIHSMNLSENFVCKQAKGASKSTIH
eukprot:1161707-Pelagomonas_calceolata.AAC.2